MRKLHSPIDNICFFAIGNFSYKSRNKHMAYQNKSVTLHSQTTEKYASKLYKI